MIRTVYGTIPECFSPRLWVLLVLLYLPALLVAEEIPLTLRSAAEPDYPPLSFQNKDGFPVGMGVDLLRAAVRTLGHNVTFKTQPWSHIKQELADGRIDVLPLVGRSKEREPIFDFTVPYLSFTGVVVMRHDSKVITSADDLYNLKVGVMAGDNAEEYLQRKERFQSLTTSTTFKDSFKQLHRGEVDAVVVSELVAHKLIRELGAENFQIVLRLDKFRQDFCFAVTEGNSKLLSQLNEGLSRVFINGTHARLMKKWFPNYDPDEFFHQSPTTVHFSHAEQQWIDNNPEVTFTGDPNWLPYEAFEADGTYIGIVAEHLKLVEQKSKLRFKPIPVVDWTESLRIATEGQVSVISGDAADAILNKQFRPIEPYSSNPIVIVMSDSENYVDKLEQLKGQRIAIIKDYGYTADIYRNYPNFKFIEVNNIQQGLMGVAEKRFDAMLATMTLASYHMSKMGLHNIKVVGKTPIVMDLTMFVDKQQPLLHSIIEKSLRATSREESQRILQRWVGKEYVEKTSYRTTILVGLSLLAVLAAILIWNRQLKQQIIRRMNAEQALEHSNSLLQEAQGLATIGNWELNPIGMKAIWSPEVFRILGIEPTDEAGPELLSSLLHPEDRESVLTSLQCAMTDGSEHDMTYRIIQPGGNIRWVRCKAKPVLDENHQITRLQGVVQDITEIKQHELELKESESRYRTIINTISEIGEGLFIVDADYRVRYMNQAMIDMFGDQTGRKCYQSVGGLDDQCTYCRLSGVIEDGETVRYQPSTADGRHFDIVAAPIKNSDGTISKLEIINDITDRRRAEDQARTLSQVVEQSPVTVMITDTNGAITYVNQAFEETSGYKLEEVLGKNPRILKSGKTPPNHYRELWQALVNGRPWNGEIQNRKKNGDLFWEHAWIAPVTNSEGTITDYLAVKEDITQRKLHEETILHQAHYDSLTTLPNRLLSLDRLGQLLKESERESEQVAVLFLDLDDFKKINDTLGHEAGDQLLIQCAQRLGSILRSKDTVGRLGGDEFIILLGSLENGEQAQPVAENILSVFRQPFAVQGRELTVSASIGISLYPSDGDNSSELLRNADAAMYHAKQQGRNTYTYFTEQMNLQVAHRLALEEQMHGAIERGEFTVVYQPQIELHSGRIVGVEALLRWQNPALGAISPIEFIPIAEQTGLIVPLGMFVLSEALTQTAQWQQDNSQDIRVAVNLSPRQFRIAGLTSDITSLLKRVGLSGESLELEITEGVLMSEESYIDEALVELDKLGISIAMDDFGTGYSSLSYLRSYPFHVLKIDRSFINDITADKSDRQLIRAANTMAQGLNMKVVAEGIETKQQLKFLKELGCDYGQGYLFSKPLPAEAMTAYLVNSGGMVSVDIKDD